MAITTLAGVSSGLQPYRRIAKSGITVSLDGQIWASTWFLVGSPAAGVADTSTAGGVTRSSTSALVTGQIPHYDPASGSAYLAFVNGTMTKLSGYAHLCDRLWDCGANSAGSALSPTLLTAQTVNSVAWPARDENSATSGVGVYIGIEVSSQLGATGTTWTISYTNSAGTSTLTGTSLSASTRRNNGCFHPVGINGGDVGVKSVESVTNTETKTSGQYVLVAYRVLTTWDLQYTQQSVNNLDALCNGFTKIQNGSVPFVAVICANTNSAGPFLGVYQEAQG